MATNEAEMAIFEYRLKDSTVFKEVRGEIREVRGTAADTRRLVDLHEEQISGEDGLRNAIHTLRKEVRAEVGSLRKAFYGLTAALIIASFSLIGAIIGHAI